MSSPQRAERPANSPECAVTSLRERKKAKTRRTIREQALRLFAERGYDGTTVEQIAEAAEISPSTFFRYFPTKEDVVIQDDHDPLLVAALERQPPGVPPLTAIRAALRDALSQIPPPEMDHILFRARLSTRHPALRARTAEGLFATMDMLAAAVARRSGRDPHSPAVRTLVGAVLGVMLPAIATWVEDDGRRPLPDLLDEALDHLESGLPL